MTTVEFSYCTSNFQRECKNVSDSMSSTNTYGGIKHMHVFERFNRNAESVHTIYGGFIYL